MIFIIRLPLNLIRLNDFERKRGLKLINPNNIYRCPKERVRTALKIKFYLGGAFRDFFIWEHLRTKNDPWTRIPLFWGHSVYYYRLTTAGCLDFKFYPSETIKSLENRWLCSYINPIMYLGLRTKMLNTLLQCSPVWDVDNNNNNHNWIFLLNDLIFN